jgi:phytoene dehydrogenase-like protein
VEAGRNIGGGARTAELTVPGYHHDVCSAVHPLGINSPFLNTVPLAEHGLKWIHSPACLAHPFDNEPAAVLYKSMAATCATLGSDAEAYARVFEPYVKNAAKVVPEILSPPIHVPRHPLLMARFGLQAVQSTRGFIHRHFRAVAARALFTGIAAHSNMPQNASPTAAFGLLLGMLGHVKGWPIVEGGSQKLSDAMASFITSLGGKIVTGTRVDTIRQLPTSRVVLLDLTPRQIVQMMPELLPPGYRRQLRNFRYGPGVFNVDWALSSPIPWKDPKCGEAATVHIGGSDGEIIEAEGIVAEGKCAEKPFVLLAQPSLFDPTRAPSGRHTAWAYCHVPANSTVDMLDRIESQIERFAPGFRDCVLARHTMNAPDFERYNPNYVGGDIAGGLQNIKQVLARPSYRWIPYSTPVPGVFICSASTPPGGGVHGMCGYHAARAALSTILYNRASRR